MKATGYIILLMGVVLWGILAVVVSLIDKEVDDIAYWSVIIIANMYLVGLIIREAINKDKS